MANEDVPGWRSAGSREASLPAATANWFAWVVLAAATAARCVEMRSRDFTPRHVLPGGIATAFPQAKSTRRMERLSQRDGGY